MLLTRSPLSENPKILFTFDLHVLSTPPAFILSQDQTLHKEFDSVDSPSPSVCPQTDNSGQSYLIQTELFVLSQRLGFEFDCLTTLQLLMYFPAASYSLTSHSQLVSCNWCPATRDTQPSYPSATSQPSQPFTLSTERRRGFDLFRLLPASRRDKCVVYTSLAPLSNHSTLCCVILPCRFGRPT